MFYYSTNKMIKKKKGKKGEQEKKNFNKNNSLAEGTIPS